MSLIAPLALISALVIGPIIVAMYLLKLRREERTVSSTFLWQRMVRDVEANAPWQKLRRNLLLFLQLLLLALLAFALARPFFPTAGIAGRNLIVIIDRSASMQASDVAPSRLEAAKQQAMTLIDQLPDDGRATVIAAGGLMDVPISGSTDRRLLRQSIEAIQPDTSGTSDLSPALTLAAALSSREAESEVAIISDGNVVLPTDLQMPATVRYFPIGQQSENVAMSALSLQPSAGGQTLFAQATNYGTASAARRLDLYLDGTLFNAYNLNLAPGGDQSVVADIPAQVRSVEARLVDNTETDVLAVDDQAWAVSNVGEGTKVRVMTGGNRFLETALSLLPSIEAMTVPANTSTFTETVAQVPVTILDGVVPTTLPPGNLFFIAPIASTEFFSITGQIDFPNPRPAPGDDPLLRNISLSEVSILKANRIVPGSWSRIVVDSDGGPLLMAGERDGRRIVVLAFAFSQSDLPLQVAFPLLVSNIMGYLAPGSGADAAQLLPGQTLAIPVDASISEVRAYLPDGTEQKITPQNGQALFVDTQQFGVYRIEQRQGERLVGRRHYAVNLYSANESRIAPQAELTIPQVSGLQQAVTQERVGRQEVWRWLAALALIVLVIEWLVYQRNGLSYLRQRWQMRRSA
jgi:Ca-activated chloride channel family protein